MLDFAEIYVWKYSVRGAFMDKLHLYYYDVITSNIDMFGICMFSCTISPLYALFLKNCLNFLRHLYSLSLQGVGL